MSLYKQSFLNMLCLTIAALFFATAYACSPIQTSSPEQKIQTAINAIRAESGACKQVVKRKQAAMHWNETLAQLAKQHSLHLAQQQKLMHVGANGRDIAARVSDSGYQWRAIAENLAQSQGGVSDVLTLWLNSPAHARNMCNPDYSEIGVAEVKGYWTAVFAQPAG